MSFRARGRTHKFLCWNNNNNNFRNVSTKTSIQIDFEKRQFIYWKRFMQTAARKQKYNFNNDNDNNRVISANFMI